jgi:hypothetical protein
MMLLRLWSHDLLFREGELSSFSFVSSERDSSYDDIVLFGGCCRSSVSGLSVLEHERITGEFE